MVGEDVGRSVVRRIVSPPALPVRVAPFARIGPNMFRPMMKAPIPSIISDITCLLTGCPPLSGPSSRCHLCSAIPPTPSGLSSSWPGPATKPSADTDIERFTLLPACVLMRHSCKWLRSRSRGASPRESRLPGFSTIRRSGRRPPARPALLSSSRPREPNARTVAFHATEQSAARVLLRASRSCDYSRFQPK